ncbi:MAG: hypothetical protein L3J76_05815, partial [Candidatus Hydrothermae bacterium]|nr:hypothetical protein [Candidatus Hydrothermae bacterium]
MTAEFEPIIGLEIHVELATRRKMFCGCPNTYGQERNTVVCPVCMGHPGTLPAPNEEAVARAVQLGLALGSEIHPFSLFYRKNYFYPDLPKGYQITQYSTSILTGGELKGVRAGGIGQVRTGRAHRRLHLVTRRPGQANPPRAVQSCAVDIKAP